MPQIYAGKFFGNIEVDEIHQTDYGRDGVTTCAIVYAKHHDEQGAQQRINELRRISQGVMARRAREQQQADDEKL